MDPWIALRDRLNLGPREGDRAYRLIEGERAGELALWTMEIRADYTERMLDRIDALEAAIVQHQESKIRGQHDTVDRRLWRVLDVEET